MITLRGKCSSFGGPDDGPAAGNDRPDWKTEGLAFFPAGEPIPIEARGLFLADARIQELIMRGFTGRARHLDPDRHYLALRLDDDPRRPGIQLDRTWWRRQLFSLRSVGTGRAAIGRIVDWGPAESTGRIVDLSPGLARTLAVATGDEVEILIPERHDQVAAGEGAPLPDEAYQPITDPRDTLPPGHGSGVRRPTGHEGRTSAIGRLVGPIGLGILAAVVAGGGAGPILSRVRGALEGLRGSESLVRSLVGLIAGPGVEGASPGEHAGLRLVGRLLETVAGIERDSPAAPGPQKHDLAVSVLRALGVEEQLAQDLVPVAVGALNAALGHRWGSAMQETEVRDQTLGQGLLRILIG